MEPEGVDVDGSLVFEGVGPFTAVLVLGVFPFWSDALFEEVVVGFETEVAAGCDVVLDPEVSAQRHGVRDEGRCNIRRCPRILLPSRTSRLLSADRSSYLPGKQNDQHTANKDT